MRSISILVLIICSSLLSANELSDEILIGLWHPIHEDPVNFYYTLNANHSFVLNILDATIEGKWELKDSTVYGIGWVIIKINQDSIITPKDTLIRIKAE